MPLRCILAEDDPAMRGWLRKILERQRVSVREASCGSELLSLLRAEPNVDVIVTDVRMPGPNGLQVLAMARDAGLNVPFLLISAFGDDQLRAMATALRASVLDKPFAAADIAAWIERIRRINAGEVGAS